MKKNIFVGIGALAIAGAIIFNVKMDLSDISLSDLTLANIEALAQNEDNDCTGLAMLNCKIWDITYHNEDHITCTPGGKYMCMFPLD